jgi:hypothetical protein
VIWGSEGDCKNINNSGYRPPYYVYTTHVRQEAENRYSVEIIFEKTPEKGEIFFPQEKVKVSLYDKDMNVISHDSVSFKSGIYSDHYTQFYNKRLPKELVSLIEFDVKIEERTVSIHKTYPLILAPHYTLWAHIASQ